MKLFVLAFFAVTLAANVEGKYYRLENLNGKCLNGNANWWSSDIYLSPCDSVHTTGWSYNDPKESKDRHICNWKCIASPQNYGGTTGLIQWGWLVEAGQRFTFKEDKYYSGYFQIVNDHGKCVSVDSNTDWARISAKDCKPYERGQLWKWYSP